MAYDLQHTKHGKNQDAIIRAISEGCNTFTKIVERSNLTKASVNKILKELERLQLVIKTGIGKKVKYSISNAAREALRIEAADVFSEVCNAFSQWRPDFGTSDDNHISGNITLTEGTTLHYPMIKTSTLKIGSTSGADQFVSSPYDVESILQYDLFKLAVIQGLSQQGKRWNDRIDDSDKHGIHHVIISIDYDSIADIISRADSFEERLTSGDTLSLIFNKYLNMDFNDPVSELLEQTGMGKYPYVLQGLQGKEYTALEIVSQDIPQILEVLHLRHRDSIDDFRTLLHAISKRIDGPFKDLLDRYSKEHGSFFSQFIGHGISGFRNILLDYLKPMGFRNVRSVHIYEFLSVLLLINIQNKEFKAAEEIIKYWGYPYII